MKLKTISIRAIFFPKGCVRLIPVIFTMFCIILQVQAQDEPKETAFLDKINFGAYSDIYYAYDFNSPGGWERGLLVNSSTHIFAHPAHNTFAVNNAVIGVSYTDANIRSALSLHTGSYVRANYAADPTLSRLIYEARIGVKVTNDLWIDAGIFPSHIGAESAISMDNLTLTRSLMADNSPYYESGIRATWEPSEKVTLVGLVLNGWQNIVENNQNKAVGTQLIIYPSETVTINSSTFFGKETPSYGTEPSTRFFHNFFIAIEMGNLTLLGAFDVGLQESLTSEEYDVWYTPNLIAQGRISERAALAGRVEYYHDPNGIIINPGLEEGFRTFGYSLNFDYALSENVLWRIEGRLFDAVNRVYLDGVNNSNDNNFFLISSLAIRFGNYPF